MSALQAWTFGLPMSAGWSRLPALALQSQGGVTLSTGGEQRRPCGMSRVVAWYKIAYQDFVIFSRLRRKEMPILPDGLQASLRPKVAMSRYHNYIQF
jgi:hypothetical protein